MVLRPDDHREGRGSNMSFVYILQSQNGGRYYIGSTNSLERRLSEHNSGKTISLKKFLPVELVFAKRLPSIVEARRIERKLKRMKSRVILQRIIEDGEIKAGL